VTEPATPPAVRTELELRVAFAGEPDRLARILKVLRKSAGALRAHLLYRLQGEWLAYFLCDRPAEGASALEREGEKVETETVVTVRTPNRPGTFSYLIQTLAAERVQVLYSYSTVMEDELLVVLRTAENPKAEDVLRNLLVLPDPSIPQGLEPRSSSIPPKGKKGGQPRKRSS
jgi:hypothetical protein